MSGEVDCKADPPHLTQHTKYAVKGNKVFYKIPARVIRDAKGLAIFTSMRTGIAPFGGAGGSGVVIARLPDGCQLNSSVLHGYTDSW